MVSRPRVSLRRWFGAALLGLAVPCHADESSKYVDSLRHLKGKTKTVKAVGGGLSNRNFHVELEEHVPWHLREYIVRVPGDVSLPAEKKYGRIHLVNRTMERRCAHAAFHGGTSPELVEYSPDGVMLTRWLKGSVFTEDSLKEQLRDVGQLLREFHESTELIEPPATHFSPMLRAENYLVLLTELGVAVPVAVTSAFPAARQLDAALRQLHAKDPPVALHCDLIPGNFIADTRQEHRLWLFDFEYCHYGHPAWDLANAIAMNRLDTRQREELMNAYNPRQDLVKESQLEVMIWLYGLSEGMWGVVQHKISDLPFDGSTTEGDAEDFHSYGMKFLDAALASLDDPDFKGHMRKVLESTQTKHDEL